MINIKNIKTYRVHGTRDIYIGRKYGAFNGSPLANTWAIGVHGDRDEVIARYAHWLDGVLAEGKGPAYDEFIRIKEMAKIGDVNLLCWCAPLRCHGDVIKEMLGK